MAKRQESVRRFQEDPDVSVAVLSVTAAGTGLTLTAASTVVFAELHWTPGIMIQASSPLCCALVRYAVLALRLR